VQRAVLIDGKEIGVIDFSTLECLDCEEQSLTELVDQAADEGFPVNVDAGKIHYEELSEENIGLFQKFLESYGYELGDEVELDPEREAPDYEDVPEEKGDEKTKEVTGNQKVKAKDIGLIMGAVTIAGFPLVIEMKAGQERYGKALPADYGYIRRTGSAEGQDVQMDCFVRDPDGEIFVVDSFVPDTGEFDEHKIMIGYKSETGALSDFENYYSGGIGEHSNFWSLKAPDRRVGYATKVTSNQLAAWLDAGDLTQPFYAPTNVEYTPQATFENERCAACEFFISSGVCSNPDVYHDPKVPKANALVGAPNAMSLVAPTGWCHEFRERKVEEAEPEGDA